MRAWYAFYPKDFMIDTMQLSLEAECLYRRMIDHYYITQTPLQNDAKWLGKCLRIHPTKLRHLLPDVLPYFEDISGRLHHKRIDAEIEKAKEIQERRAEAGRKGGQAKAKQLPKTKPSKCLSMPQPQPQPLVNTTNQDLSKTDTEQFLPPEPENVSVKPKSSKPEKTYAQDIPYDDIIELYHKHAPSLKPCEKMTMQLMRDIQILWNDKRTGLPDLKHWENFFIDCESSDWLTARTRSKRRAHLLRELVAPETYAKIYEGAYE